MKKQTYKYVSPLDSGMKQFKLTKEQHDTIFANHKRKWCWKYKYYYDDKLVTIHRYTNVLGIVFMTLLYPINILLCGLKDLKDLNSEMYKLYHQKKTGYYTSHSVFKGSDTYKKIMEILIDKDMCVIGVDIANPNCKDFSAISAICANCNTVIWSKTFSGTNSEYEKSLVPDVCPNCGVKFVNKIT